MQRLIVGAALSAVCLLTLGSSVPARALVIAAPPGPAQAAQSDAVVVGRVVAIADQDIEASPAKGANQKMPYRVAIIQVTDILKGGKAKTVKVGYPAPQQVQPGLPGGGIRPIRPGFRGGMQLQVGMDGMFYLNKHHEGKFYVMAHPFGSYITRENNENFDREVTDVRKTLKILENPMVSLKSKDADERYLTAALLIQQYRTYQGSQKTEPVKTEESKLILTALAEADWDQQKWVGTRGQMAPMSMFYRLNITPNDGYNQPRFQQGQNPQEFQKQIQQSMKDWLKKNASTYRIQRYVKGEGGNVGGPGRPVIGVPVQPVPGGPIRIQPAPRPIGRPQILPVRPGVRIQPAQPQIQILPAVEPQPLPVQPEQPIR